MLATECHAEVSTSGQFEGCARPRCWAPFLVGGLYRRHTCKALEAENAQPKRLQADRIGSARTRVITDNATHESAIEIDHAIGGDHLTRILEAICSQRGKPLVIRSDNSPEFTGRTMMVWGHRHGIALRPIEPVSRPRTPTSSRSTGDSCDECLNERWFTRLAHARAVIESWRREYNEERPNRSLGGLTPAQFTKQLAIKAVTMPADSKALRY